MKTDPPVPSLAPEEKSLDRALRAFATALSESGVDSPRLSAELLLARALGMDRSALLKLLLLEPEKRLEPQVLDLARSLVERRSKGEPAAYILGFREFYGRDFNVTPDTLIPRPETELLVDLALERARSLSRPGIFADFGTGSGCLAVTLACELPLWRGVALDTSRPALTVARENARRNCPEQARRLLWLEADFTLPPLAPASLDLLVANPPYVSEAEYRTLAPGVREFEPKSALVPATSGAPCRKGFAAPHKESGMAETAARYAEGRHSGMGGESGRAKRQAEGAGRGRETGCAAAGPAGEYAGPYREPGASGLEDGLAVMAAAARLLRPGGWLLMEIGHGQGGDFLQALDPAVWTQGRIQTDLASLDRALTARKNGS